MPPEDPPVTTPCSCVDYQLRKVSLAEKVMADAVAEDGLVNDTTLSTVIGTLLDRSDFFHMHVAIECVKQGTLGD